MVHWKSQKLNPFKPSVFDTMGQLAAKHAEVNLGQGFPDFDGPPMLKEAACRAIQSGHNQYGPLPGMPVLNRAISGAYQRLYGLDYNPETEITVTNGATEAMYATLSGILNPGDEVIVFEPVYDTYMPISLINGAVPVPVPLDPPRFHFQRENLAKAFGPKTKAIVVNSPHNPAGAVFDEKDMQTIADLCIQHDVIAVTDEVYEHLIFDVTHKPLATFPGMRERTITISSTSKTFSYTGWKIGWACGPAGAMEVVRRMHQFLAFCVATPLQQAMAEAMDKVESLAAELRSDLHRKRDFLCQHLTRLGFKLEPPEGTYFVLADFSDIADKNDVDYAKELILSDVKVGTIPVSVFYAIQDHAPKHYLRFCFAKQQATLDKGVVQLEKLRG